MCGVNITMSGDEGEKRDELKERLMGLMNSWIDDERLKRMHESMKGSTQAERKEYWWLQRMAEGILERTE